jgi:hypothetical protein
MVKLFGKAIRVNKASQDKNSADVGANLFIGNLDPDVDEKVRARQGGGTPGGVWPGPGGACFPAAVPALLPALDSVCAASCSAGWWPGVR